MAKMVSMGWQDWPGTGGSFPPEPYIAFRPFPATHSGRGAESGRFRPECLAAFPRNRWQDSAGTGGRFGPEYSLSISDMSGNVNEWCWDWAGAGMTGNNPTGAATGTNRILRGGSYSTDESTARVSSIVQDYPSNRQPNRGLRLVRSLP